MARTSATSACSTGIAHPVGIAASTDQVAVPLEFDRVHRQREFPAAFSPADFEHVEVAADQADPNERNDDAAKDALHGARPEIVLSTPGHRIFHDSVDRC